MQELLINAENERIVFVEDLKDLQFVKDLSQKHLCIIKTDFQNINQIKKFCKEYPELEVWLASLDISRKHILAANSCGIKNVISYPVETRLVHDFLRKKTKSDVSYNNYNNSEFLRGMKVLIVDDNKMNIDLLVEILSPIGLGLSTFIKPKDACQAVKEEKFDLCLLDIMMPEMSGFDLAREIKNTELNANTPMMFISALSDPENKIKSFDIGSCAYIEKPFDINVVRSQIYNMLKTRNLEKMLQERQESFLTLVTHDLKTPVNAEIQALELLLNNKHSILNKFQAEIIKDLLGAAKYMKNLVDNIMQKYKYENDKPVLYKTNYSLKVLVMECIEEIKYLMEEKRQVPVFNCSAKNSDIYIDYIEIKRVIHNLLINANEYGKKGTKIELTLDESPTDLIFSVKNYGNVINISNKNILFEKDFSCQNPQKSAGTGLGLYISKRIIDAHNGTISAETEAGKYTKITFTLPKDAL